MRNLVIKYLLLFSKSKNRNFNGENNKLDMGNSKTNAQLLKVSLKAML